MNILWIMTDQLQADCLGFMGHPLAQTPNLDRLAASSVVFDNAFCQSPVCMASRAVLFTGRYPATIGVRGMGILPPTETTLPEVLQRYGYRTGAFGQVHLTPELYTCHQLKSDVPTLDLRRFAKDSLIAPITDDPYKQNYGFQVHEGYEDCLKGRFFDWLKQRAPELVDAKPVSFSPEGPGDLYVSPYPSELHPSTFIASRANDFIRNQQNASPWFTFCSFVAPHHPFEAPADQIARYAAESIPLPQSKGGVEARFIPAPASTAIGEALRFSEAIRRRIVHHYLASISLIDDAVGSLVATLEATGQLENTLIMFTGDHGEFLGNHDLLRKPSLHYDEVLHVPLLLHLPGGQTAPRHEAGLVELADVCPTLLGLLNVKQPAGIQGIDWSQPLRESGMIGREEIYADMFDMEPMLCGQRSGPYMAVQTLRTAHWKLNIYPTASHEHGQLFNLADDPDESRNRYDDPACRSIREEMLWRLLRRNHLNTDPLPPWLTQY